MRGSDVRRQRVDAFLREFKSRIVVIEPVLPVVRLFEHADLERVGLEARVEHIKVEIAHLVGVDVVGQGLVVGFWPR